LNFLRFRFPGTDKVKCAFGTRLGGTSQGLFYSNNISFEVGDSGKNVLENREAVRKELSFNRLMELRQVHGSDIRYDIEADYKAGAEIHGDGAFISLPGSALMIKTADCQPVFLVHTSGKYSCGLHIGWRGNRMDFPGKGVREFCAYYKIHPEDIQAVRGPSLGPCCARFDVFEEHWSRDFSPYYHKKSMTMDLWSLTRDQLTHAGLLKDNIFSIDLCTQCLSDLFFSYRREKKCGRQGNYVFIQT